MNKIILTGENCSKQEAIDSIKAIYSDSMDVKIIMYEVHVELRPKLIKHDNYFIKVNSYTPDNKLGVTKMIKDLINSDLKTAKLLADENLSFEKRDYPISIFVSRFFKDQISVEQFLNFYQQNEEHVINTLNIELIIK